MTWKQFVACWALLTFSTLCGIVYRGVQASEDTVVLHAELQQAHEQAHQCQVQLATLSLTADADRLKASHEALEAEAKKQGKSVDWSKVPPVLVDDKTAPTK